MDSAYRKQMNINLILETHSKVIVNKVGKLIKEKQISEKLVSILIFEKPKSSEVTNIRVAGFTKNGLLENWPYGFFEPGID
jgi:predicted ATPase